jgi:ArsR family transcriptional regulator, arsenate/arsenite/antimonite-responsive transcriptional repressor
MPNKITHSSLSDAAAAQMLAALGSQVRLLIYRTLLRAGSEGLTISTVQSMTDIPPSTLKHHLDALVQADLVEQDKRGREVYCTSNYANVRLLSAFLLKECCSLSDLAKTEISEPTSSRRKN